MDRRWFDNTIRELLPEMLRYEVATELLKPFAPQQLILLCHEERALRWLEEWFNDRADAYVQWKGPVAGHWELNESAIREALRTTAAAECREGLAAEPSSVRG